MRKAMVPLSMILFGLAAWPAEPPALAPAPNAPSETALGKLAARQAFASMKNTRPVGE